MKVWSNYLDDRPEKAKGRPATEDWMLSVLAPEERLIKFDAWVSSQLAQRLQWPENPTRRAKLIGQCRARLERLALDLWRRGWMLDGKALAGHIRAALEDIAAAQAAGRVKDFWPFFVRVVDSYVGLNAEEILAEARRQSGTKAAGDLMQQALAGLPTAPAIPALIAQRREELNQEREIKLRVRVAKARVKDSADGTQGLLF